MEINPSSFVLVLGPSFTGALLRESEGATRNAPALDLKAMVDEGIAILLQSRHFQSEAERSECEQLYRRALEVDPLAKLTSSMQQCGRYADWLERCFRLDPAAASNGASKRQAAILERLVSLVEKGALVLYTGCDDALSKHTSLQVLLAQTKEAVVQWGKGGLRGIMHVHGVYWKPDSLQLACEVYVNPNHPARAAMEQLGAIFQERRVITLGVYEPQQLDNPMMTNFATSFLATTPRHCFNIALTPNSYYRDPGATKLLHLHPSPSGEIPPILPVSEASRMLCKLKFQGRAEVPHQFPVPTKRAQKK